MVYTSVDQTHTTCTLHTTLRNSYQGFTHQLSDLDVVHGPKYTQIFTRFPLHDTHGCGQYYWYLQLPRSLLGNHATPFTSFSTWKPRHSIHVSAWKPRHSIHGIVHPAVPKPSLKLRAQNQHWTHLHTDSSFTSSFNLHQYPSLLTTRETHAENEERYLGICAQLFCYSPTHVKVWMAEITPWNGWLRCRSIFSHLVSLSSL